VLAGFQGPKQSHQDRVLPLGNTLTVGVQTASRSVGKRGQVDVEDKGVEVIGVDHGVHLVRGGVDDLAGQRRD